MCTTLDVEDAVLHAAKEIARQRGVPVGKEVSDLVRQALMRQVNAVTALFHRAVLVTRDEGHFRPTGVEIISLGLMRGPD